jgi:hypothetical protein
VQCASPHGGNASNTAARDTTNHKGAGKYMWLETQKGVLVNLDSLEYILTEKDLDYAFIWLREYLKENQLLLPLSIE